jgi:hypothetical protein
MIHFIVILQFYKNKKIKFMFQKIKLHYLLILFLTFFIINVDAFSQSGMNYTDFAKKLETYFHPDLIADIKNELETTDIRIWGWDVGDFSDDGNNDVAFCVRKVGSKNRNMDVYLFADIDGFLVKVGQLQYEFVELPLEVGVAFRYGIVYITQKFKQYHWKIDGYKFIEGSLIKYDNYITSRKGKLTNETYRNYYTLQNTEKYLNTASGKTDFWASYLSIPAYSRNRMIYKGTASFVYNDNIDYVPEGAYWWSGEKDFSYNVSAAYDDDNLYFTIYVIDDTVVAPYSNIANGEAIELWLDVTDYPISTKRFANTKDKKEDEVIYNKTMSDANNIYSFGIYVGDFVKKEPIMWKNDTDKLDNYFPARAKSDNIIADLTDNGYYVIFKIPFSDIGRSGPPVTDSSIVEWGATLRVIDVDNEFRPERRTVMQTSLFDKDNPSSYGSIIFVPDEKWYGETSNVFQQKILTTLEEMGF